MRREPTILVPTEGIVGSIEDLPKNLQRPLMVEDILSRAIFVSIPLQNYLIDNPTYFPRVRVKGFRTEGRVLGSWSGYRSVIVNDEKGRAYRLKGVAFGEHPVKFKREGVMSIQGGQFEFYADNELEQCARFNEYLEKVGVEPAMTPVGKVLYDHKFRSGRLCGSIFKITGDTRADELFHVIERLALETGEDRNISLEEIGTGAQRLYYDIGFKAGALMAMLNQNKQTWSATRKSTNSHYGNVVVYRSKKDRLGVGLADFDSSCDERDLDLNERIQQSYSDLERLDSSSIQGTPISMRLPQGWEGAGARVIGWRGNFIYGVYNGYQWRMENRNADFDNTFSSDSLEEIFRVIPKKKKDYVFVFDETWIRNSFAELEEKERAEKVQSNLLGKFI